MREWLWELRFDDGRRVQLSEHEYKRLEALASWESLSPEAWLERHTLLLKGATVEPHGGESQTRQGETP